MRERSDNPEARRYRVDTGRPEGQNDTLHRFAGDESDALCAAQEAAAAQTACRGIIFDVVCNKEYGHVVNTDQCIGCEKCHGGPAISELPQPECR